MNTYFYFGYFGAIWKTEGGPPKVNVIARLIEACEKGIARVLDKTQSTDARAIFAEAKLAQELEPLWLVIAVDDHLEKIETLKNVSFVMKNGKVFKQS